MNYRSVVLLDCRGRELEGEEKWEAMHRITEKLVPGRWDDARQPNDKEVKGTTLVSFPIDLASAKVRSGPPVDDEEDYNLGMGRVVLTGPGVRCPSWMGSSCGVSCLPEGEQREREGFTPRPTGGKPPSEQPSCHLPLRGRKGARA
jgi:hypothetical protein